MPSTDPREKYPKPGSTENPQQFPGIEEHMVTKPVFAESAYRASGKLQGKKALITGGDSGIGRAIAVAFAKEGADVAIAYLPEEEVDGEITIENIKACGTTAVALPGDLHDESYCTSLVDRATSALGSLDILINNAALQKCFTSLDDMTADDFARIYHINVIAPFMLSQAAAKHMPPGASIINTVSIQAYEPSSFLLPYAASKSALVALTKGLSKELLKSGIRVNAVAPGPIWSPLNTHGSPEKKLKQFGEKSAFGRPGQPIELAAVYVLLASDDASYITGEIYGITGGEGIA